MYDSRWIRENCNIENHFYLKILKEMIIKWLLYSSKQFHKTPQNSVQNLKEHMWNLLDKEIQMEYHNISQNYGETCLQAAIDAGGVSTKYYFI